MTRTLPFCATPVLPVRVTLVHLIHARKPLRARKTTEFSRLSMTQHWEAGQHDVKKTFAHKEWRDRTIEVDGLRIFDLTAKPDDA